MTAEPGNYSGVDLMNEVFDLLAHRVPHLALDDSYRPRLMAVLPQMGSRLGRPPVAAVASVPSALDPVRRTDESGA
jgi:hypothetical protein